MPFLVSIILTALGVYLRFKLAESPVFEDIKKRGEVARVPIAEVLGRHLPWVLVGVAVAAGHAVLAYTSTGYIFTYLVQTAKRTPVEANIIVGAAALAQIPLYLFAAWLGDRVGRKAVYMTGLAIGLATYYPLYYLLPSLDLWLAALAVYVMVGATAFTFGILGTALAELFPARVRYSGMSLAFNLGVGLFGGFTPTIVQLIGTLLKNPLAGLLLYTYVVAAAALIIAALILPETKSKDVAA
ncbi:MFS transporter [Pyrobaculum sp.]